MPKIVTFPARTRLEVLAKDFLTTKDIQVLCQVGSPAANAIRNKYKEWIAANNIKVFDVGRVDTDLFVKFTNEEVTVPTVNVERIEKYAKKGL